MTRTLLWGAAGIAVGLILHLLIILARPDYGSVNFWAAYGSTLELDTVVTLEAPPVGADNPLGLDPEIVYALCRFDLADGPGVFTGTLPDDFWSVSIFDDDGVAVYSTTSRSGVGNSLQLGIFNNSQTRLLAEQQIEISEGLLIVESPHNSVIAAVRLAVPHPAMRTRYRALLSNLQCGHLQDPVATSDTSVPA